MSSRANTRSFRDDVRAIERRDGHGHRVASRLCKGGEKKRARGVIAAEMYLHAVKRIHDAMLHDPGQGTGRHVHDHGIGR